MHIPTERAALVALGWTIELEQQLQTFARDGLLPARVTSEQRGRYHLASAGGELPAGVTGRFHRDAVRRVDYPAVGDWVLAAPNAGLALVHEVLPRRTAFVRAHQSGRTDSQAPEAEVIAANVDTAFVVAGLNEDVNLARLERYLAGVASSGARAVIVLTKADLAKSRLDSAVAIAGSMAPVAAVSSVTGAGFDDLEACLVPGQTVVVVGPSGAGKSTLINRLLGEERLATGDIRADGRGRHTTTHRMLLRLPGGALVIDTPGLRELQLWGSEDDVEGVFPEIEVAAAGCRFADCAHESEPGCAVRAAVATGTIDERRFASFEKLRREVAYLERKEDRMLQQEEHRRWKQIHKELRQWGKVRGKE